MVKGPVSTAFIPDPISAQPERRALGPRETRRLTAPPGEVLARRTFEQGFSRGFPVLFQTSQPFINLFKGPTTRLFQEPFVGGGTGGAIDIVEAARKLNPFRPPIEFFTRRR